MSTKCRKAINFDLDTKALRLYYNKSHDKKAAKQTGYSMKDYKSAVNRSGNGISQGKDNAPAKEDLGKE